MGRLTPPVLETRRLRLNPLTADHVTLLIDLNADTEVMRHILGRPASVVETLGALRSMLAHPDGLGYWCGFAGREFVGWWCLVVKDDPATGWLGYRLRRAAWGHGYATEGALALLAHAFGTRCLDAVRAETMAVNTRSRAVLERLGMTHVDTWWGEWEDPLPGADEGEVVYELTRPSGSPDAAEGCPGDGAGGLPAGTRSLASRGLKQSTA